MSVSRTLLTLLPGGLTPSPTVPKTAQPRDSTLVVDAVLTVQVGRRQDASAVTLIRGGDGHWLGRIGSSQEALTGQEK